MLSSATLSPRGKRSQFPALGFPATFVQKDSSPNDHLPVQGIGPHFRTIPHQLVVGAGQGSRPCGGQELKERITKSIDFIKGLKAADLFILIAKMIVEPVATNAERNDSSPAARAPTGPARVVGNSKDTGHQAKTRRDQQFSRLLLCSLERTVQPASGAPVPSIWMR
jgi:hypothetical protein